MVRWTAAAAAAVLLLGGCGSAEEQAAPDVAEPMDLVVIGDSIAASGWAEQYAAALQAEREVTVRPRVETTMTIPDAVKAVAKAGAARDAVAAADIVVVQVGYNNALPVPGTGVGCGGTAKDDSAAAFAAWARTTDEECLGEWVETYAALYDQVLQGVQSLRGDQPTVFAAMGAPNADLAPPEAFPDWLLAGFGDEAKGTQWLGAAYDRWNAMIEERAAAAGYQYVDVYHAFNGLDARSTYYPELTDDGVHPNDAGNEVIVELLGEVDLSALSDR